MNEEVIETAKATQEVAKTANNALDKGAKLGRFLTDVFEDGIGIVSDKLEFMRWERKIRFIEKVEEINKKRDLCNKTQYVPPKLAIPILENASIEEDNNLQDLWAKLLSSSQDEAKNIINRTAFIDILKQLEYIDALFLNKLYNDLLQMQSSHEKIAFDKYKICSGLNISYSEYENICDNLMRLRLIKSNIVEMEGISMGGLNSTIDRGYDEICITSLGMSFIKCCIID